MLQEAQKTCYTSDFIDIMFVKEGSLKGPFKYDYMISHLRWGGCQKSCGDHYQDNKKKYRKEE